MMTKIQKFGSAMLTPVLLFSFAGLMLAISLTLNNPMIVGRIASEGTNWYNFWKIIESGAWTVFSQIELLFVIGIAIGLAKIANARAALEALVIYLTFNYFINAILTYYGTFFGFDMTKGAIAGSGLKSVAGIITLDTGVIGAIAISLITILLHNKYFNKKLHDVLGVFQGSSLVVMIGFVVMLPLSLLALFTWPYIQHAVASIQDIMVASKSIGVFIYTFLERSLIPTGLHHFIYQPFVYGPAVVESGLKIHWVENMHYFAQSTDSLINLFPEGGFNLHGNAKIFGSIGIALSFYLTAKPEKKKKVLAILIPATLTSVLTGITEPLEFTFLFIAPVLFFIHSLLAAFMAMIMYLFGVVGDFGGGLIDFIGLNWIPMAANHINVMITQIVIGLIFTAIYTLIFRYLILKFNFITPGRESATIEAKLYSKQDFKEKQTEQNLKQQHEKKTNEQSFLQSANHYLVGLGGEKNIKSLTNCATRLRVEVFDSKIVQNSTYFKEGKAHGLVQSGNNFQIIVGLSVPQVREAFEKIIQKERGEHK